MTGDIYSMLESEGIPMKRPPVTPGFGLQRRRQDEDEDGEVYMSEPEDGEAEEDQSEEEGERNFWELMEAAHDALAAALAAYRKRRAVSSAAGVYG